MSTVNFGGLATGMDTNALIDQLMAIERLPLTRLETEKSYLNSRLSAFSEFETKLTALQDAFEAMDTSSELRAYSASVPSEDYISVSASSSAEAATYSIKVVTLAQQEKWVAAGWADQDTTTDTGDTLSFTVDGVQTDITTTGLTLAEIAQAINDSGATASASIINDGTASPYRLVITADNAGEQIVFVDNGAANSDLYDDFTVGGTETQGAESNIQVDGIDIYGTSNTITDAIEGVTIDLNKISAGEITTLTIGVDEAGVKSKIDTFISKYNDIINFVSEQSDSSWGRDQGLVATKRRLQNLLTTKIDGTGSYNYLTELGITTDQKTGTLSVDSTTLNDAISSNLADVEKLIIGEDGVEGIADKFTDFLDGMTDSVDGIYAARKTTTDSSLRWLDNRIVSLELRMEKRELALRAQFSAMEALVSSLNTQSNYLTQQMSLLN